MASTPATGDNTAVTLGTFALEQRMPGYLAAYSDQRSTLAAKALALGVAMTLACAGLAMAPAPAPTPAATAPAKEDAKAERPMVATTDWIAADALRLIAGDDVDVILVPGLPANTPASAAPAQTGTARTGERSRQQTELVLSEETRTAIDNADGLLSTDESRDLHIATRELCPQHAALVTAIRPQLRVKRADGSIEPAFWLDAALWARTVSVSRQALSKVAPDKDQAFQTRARDVRNTLMALNDKMLVSYSELPKDAILVVGAEGLGQVGRVHEREVRVVPSSLKTDADQAAMRELVDLIASRRIPVVFPIDGAPNANLEELVKRVKARGGDVRIGDALHVDTPLAGDDGSAGAVERVIRHNARVIRDGFTPKGLPTAP